MFRKSSAIAKVSCFALRAYIVWAFANLNCFALWSEFRSLANLVWAFALVRCFAF